MTELIVHLIGDYILQTDKMAREKVIYWQMALLHAFCYTIPFLLITLSFTQLLFIFLTHAIIDHYRLAKYICFYKNQLHGDKYELKDCPTGYPATHPLGLVLLIITDNTLHLICNHFALNFL